MAAATTGVDKSPRSILVVTLSRRLVLLSDISPHQPGDQHCDVKLAEHGLHKKYLPEFRGVLPALKVARLFQLENKINAEIYAQLAVVVPLIDPS